MISNESSESIPGHEIIELARRRAENLYDARKLCCSESLLLVLNHGFNGSLSTEQAKQLLKSLA